MGQRCSQLSRVFNGKGQENGGLQVASDTQKDMIEEIKKLKSVLHTKCRERSILEQRLTCAENIIHTLGRNMEENKGWKSNRIG